MNKASVPRLSIVVPAYNEAVRLPRSLQSIFAFSDSRPGATEVIIVDDGSDDDTLAIARGFKPATDTYRVLNQPHRGKAAAVRAGMLDATGDVLMFTDADLSTPIEFVNDLIAAIEAGADIAIGSREGAGAQRSGEPGYRHLMGRAFNRLVRTLAVPGLDDTQCGFKAFTREAAHDLFRRVRLYSGDDTVKGPLVTGFDVEVLYLAHRRGYVVVETPVIWAHVSGSKVRPMRDSVRMVGDVLRVRYFAVRGFYD